MLDAIADLFDPDVENGDQKLIFARRRAGNPKSATGTAAEIERMMIGADLRRLYREMLAEGHSRHGLKKRVSDVIGERYDKKGSSIDKLWAVIDAERYPARRRPLKPSLKRR